MPCSFFKQVEEEAKERVIQAGGNPDDEEWILSMSFLQFGKYQGKSFLWLLQNDIGWTVMLMADHEQAREKTKRTNDAHWDNKEALYRYIKT